MADDQRRWTPARSTDTHALTAAHGAGHGPPADAARPEVLLLQRAIGNARTAALLHADPTGAGREPSGAPVAVQRAWLRGLRDNARVLFGKAAAAPPVAVDPERSPTVHAMDAQQRSAHAEATHGAVGGETPDYSDPELSDVPATRHVVTLATSVEHPEWLQDVKELRSAGLRKARTSPRKLLRSLGQGSTDRYLGTRVLKKRYQRRHAADGATPWSDYKRTAAAAEEWEKFSGGLTMVGHVWVRFTSYVNGRVRDVYSYGMYPQRLYLPEMGEVVGGFDQQAAHQPMPAAVLHPDVRHEHDDHRRYQDHVVTPKRFLRGLARARRLQASPPPYVLVGYNCAAFAREVVRAAGCPYPGSGILPWFAYTPASLYEALARREAPGGPIRSSDPADYLRDVGAVIDDVVMRRHLEAVAQSERDAWGDAQHVEPVTLLLLPRGTPWISYSQKLGHVRFERASAERFPVIRERRVTVYLDDSLIERWNAVPMELEGRLVYARARGPESIEQAPKRTIAGRDEAGPSTAREHPHDLESETETSEPDESSDFDEDSDSDADGDGDWEIVVPEGWAAAARERARRRSVL